MNDVDAIAAALSPAQKEALLTAPTTPLGNTWLTCRGSTKSALVAKRLATGYGDWCTLTELGSAVRECLAQGTEARRAET